MLELNFVSSCVINDFNTNGFVVVKAAFNEAELASVKDIALQFHESWKLKNKSIYEQGAVNSAYLTKEGALTEPARLAMFQFISSNTVSDIILKLIGPTATFVNTQLFFDPRNPNQSNYWHRDPQYHLSLGEQKSALLGPQVVHFRVALKDEPGIELVPQTHKRWDTDEELTIRLEQHGRKNHEKIDGALQVGLSAGDILIFCANMIHRGIYGLDRFALDILLCESDPIFKGYITDGVLPSECMMQKLVNPFIFSNAYQCILE
ncbi:phytanoyl-CoA dioxygenase [Pseudoalteromonas sp. MSK9-3]|nr:phytanoyl-CoA dioxygenase [Pseudoalteromonas sp. MSK9-3]